MNTSGNMLLSVNMDKQFISTAWYVEINTSKGYNRALQMITKIISGVV